MGWLFFEKPTNIKRWFEDQLTWDNEEKGVKHRCLASSILRRTTAYGAMEITGPGAEHRVIGIVFLLKYAPKEYPYDFGYKDLDEDMGPFESQCPDRVLDLLTPTENETALRWRERCREYNQETRRISALKKKLGVLLSPRDGKPLTLNGQDYSEFVLRASWKPRSAPTCYCYRPETGLRPTLFRANRYLLSQLEEKQT